jgi:hypothetical protein
MVNASLRSDIRNRYTMTDFVFRDQVRSDVGPDY